MIRKSTLVRLAFASAIVAGAVSAQAVTFSNVIIQSPPLSTGSSFSTIGNSISFFTPNAIVGDAVDPLRAGTLNIQFDASNFGGGAIFADEVVVNLQGVTLGSGVVFFIETIIELDALGNEIGGIIGSASHVFDSSSSPVWSTTIVLDHTVHALRAKKSFTLAASATDVTDLAAVAGVNQNLHIIPEPATMAALGMGAVALLARRRRK
jgi:hypothetical protein